MHLALIATMSKSTSWILVEAENWKKLSHRWPRTTSDRLTTASSLLVRHPVCTLFSWQSTTEPTTQQLELDNSSSITEFRNWQVRNVDVDNWARHETHRLIIIPVSIAFHTHCNCEREQFSGCRIRKLTRANLRKYAADRSEKYLWSIFCISLFAKHDIFRKMINDILHTRVHNNVWYLLVQNY